MRHKSQKSQKTVTVPLAVEKRRQPLDEVAIRKLMVLLMGALVYSYRIGRFGKAEGFELSAEERRESIEAVKPLIPELLGEIVAMEKSFYG
jgi:hypothetical protein